MKAKYIFSALALSALMFTSCNDLLDIPQHGVLNNETYYQTDEEAESAIIACYTTVQGLGYNALLGKNCLTDDFWAGGGGRADNADLEACNEFTFNTDLGFLEGMWTSYYGMIYRANVVLERLGDDSDVKLRAKAEAKVFRAWAHFELTSMWGTPPIVDHLLAPSEYQIDNGKPEDLYALMEKDLTEAINSGKLTEKESVNDKTWRITKQYAQALLGKVYLWQGKNAEAAAVLDEVVKSGKYELWHNYENLMTYPGKQNPESMFESVRVYDPNNTWLNFYSIVGVMVHYRTDKMTGDWKSLGLANTGWGFMNPQKNLYDDFVAVEGEDGYRLNATIKTYDQMQAMGVKVNQPIINEGYFMWKWRFTAEADDLPDIASMADSNNFHWMRYAEVLLLAAEAHLENNPTKALEYFNMIRTRAQAPTATSITLEDIQREKRLELCGEGVRFQDMLRWGIAEKRMKDQGAYCPELQPNGDVVKKVYNSDPAKFGFKTKHNLLPIPGTETRLNKVIDQNPGW